MSHRSVGGGIAIIETIEMEGRNRDAVLIDDDLYAIFTALRRYSSDHFLVNRKIFLYTDVESKHDGEVDWFRFCEEFNVES